MELTVDYIPALIVARDCNGDYVKVSESDEQTIYYCPICGGEVKCRAKNSSSVQPHFYHIGDKKCDNEGILHWMYKNWLFCSGSTFVVSGKEYTVESIDIEKELDTPYGKYKPDIIVNTEGKQFFFEINFSNKKDGTYSDKWSYLGNDVVEVNVKELLYSDINNNVPVFKEIFKDGVYTSKYEKKERKDKYSKFKKFVNPEENADKNRVEKFAWFWKDVVGDGNSFETSLMNMEYSDAYACTMFLKKIKCIDKFQKCKELLNKRLISMLLDMTEDYNYSIDIEKHYSCYHDITISCSTKYGVVSRSFSVKGYSGIFKEEDVINDFKENYEFLHTEIKKSLAFADTMEKVMKKKEKCKYYINFYSKCNYYVGVNLKVNAYIERTGEYITVFDEIVKHAPKDIQDMINNTIDREIKQIEESEKYKVELKYIKNNKDEVIKLIPKYNNMYSLEYDELNDSVTVLYDGMMVGIRYLYNLNNVESFYNYLKSEELEDDMKKVLRLHKNFDIVNTEINNCKNKLWKSSVSYSGDVVRQSLTYSGGNEDKTRVIEYLVSWSLSKRKIREECARVMNILCSLDRKYTNVRTFIMSKQEEN